MTDIKLGLLPTVSSGDASADYVIANIGGNDVRIKPNDLLNALSSRTRSYVWYQITSGVTINNSTTTLLKYATKVTDLLNEYNISTGVFTATYAGTYNVSASVALTASSSGNNSIYIKINGTYQFYHDWVNIGAFFTINITKTVNLAAGDTVEIYFVQDSGVSKTTHNDGLLCNLTIAKSQ